MPVKKLNNLLYYYRSICTYVLQDEINQLV